MSLNFYRIDSFIVGKIDIHVAIFCKRFLHAINVINKISNLLNLFNMACSYPILRMIYNSSYQPTGVKPVYFPDRKIDWLYACVSTISVNTMSCWFFKRWNISLESVERLIQYVRFTISIFYFLFYLVVIKDFIEYKKINNCYHKYVLYT